MTGLEYIHSKTEEELSQAFMVGLLAAGVVKSSTMEEMEQNEFVCPQGLIENYPAPCKTYYSAYSCVQCRKEFLRNEVEEV